MVVGLGGVGGGVSDGGVEQLVAAATVGLIEEGAGVEIVGGEGDAGTREVEAVPDVGVDLVDLLDQRPPASQFRKGRSIRWESSRRIWVFCLSLIRPWPRARVSAWQA